MPKWGMVIDLNRCVGCAGCQIACKAENCTPLGVTFSWVDSQEIGTYPNARRVAVPMICMHCDEPECEKICPAGATEKREDGIVTVNPDLCMGCKSCVVACPYGARYMYEKATTYFPSGPTPFEKLFDGRHSAGTVLKCDFCLHRIEEGLRRGLTPGKDREVTPACVINCMAKARYFGDLDDPESEVAQLNSRATVFPLKPECNTRPKVAYGGYLVKK